MAEMDQDRIQFLKQPERARRIGSSVYRERAFRRFPERSPPESCSVGADRLGAEFS